MLFYVFDIVLPFKDYHVWYNWFMSAAIYMYVVHVPLFIITLLDKASVLW